MSVTRMIAAFDPADDGFPLGEAVRDFDLLDEFFVDLDVRICTAGGDDFGDSISDMVDDALSCSAAASDCSDNDPVFVDGSHLVDICSAGDDDFDDSSGVVDDSNVVSSSAYGKGFDMDPVFVDCSHLVANDGFDVSSVIVADPHASVSVVMNSSSSCKSTVSKQ